MKHTLPPTHPSHWTDEELVAFYDERPNITLSHLSAITARPVADLKSILMQPRETEHD